MRRTTMVLLVVLLGAQVGCAPDEDGDCPSGWDFFETLVSGVLVGIPDCNEFFRGGTGALVDALPQMTTGPSHYVILAGPTGYDLRSSDDCPAGTPALTEREQKIAAGWALDLATNTYTPTGSADFSLELDLAKSTYGEDLKPTIGRRDGFALPTAPPRIVSTGHQTSCQRVRSDDWRITAEAVDGCPAGPVGFEIRQAVKLHRVFAMVARAVAEDRPGFDSVDACRQAACATECGGDDLAACATCINTRCGAEFSDCAGVGHPTR